MAVEKDIDKELLDFERNGSENWQRIIFNLRKQLDIWAHDNIKPIWKDMKLSYMPVMFNISVEGSTASEIAKKSMLPKQTISRSIKELEDKGFIISATSGKDKRIEVLSLTKSGKEFILNAKNETQKMNLIYKQLVGKKDLNTAVRVINSIIDYHESTRLSADPNFTD